MNDLEICKRIAEIECANVIYEHGGKLFAKDPHGNISINSVSCSEYNPLTDKALNCELRDKHEVQIHYQCQTVLIRHALTHEIQAWVEFDSKEEIPRTVLLCIIEDKANGNK